MIPTGAGQARQLQRGHISQYDFPGWWSADGKVLSFAAQELGRGTRVYSQGLPEGAPRQRTPELQFLGMLRPHFAVTPDASWVAATPAGTWKIHIYDAAGKDLGEAHGTTDDDVAAAFLGDRSLIVGPRQGRLPLQFYLVNTDTGKRELWKQFAPPDRAGLRADWNLSVTPDLKYYTYSLTQASSELFIMECIVNLASLCIQHKLHKEVIFFMDPVENPYSPGAGSPPPELAGRDRIREQVRVAIARIRVGNSAKSVLMVGLRGVGKTVLLDQMRSDAERTGIHTIRIEAPENKSLPALLAPQLRLALLRLSHVEAAKSLATKGLRALAGFAKALKIKYEDIEVGLDFEPEAGLADNGDLEGDLTSLLEQVGAAAKGAGTAVILFIDELQYIKEDQFAALISALHRCAQGRLPVTVVGAGLPQLLALAGNAKSYAERLFDFPQIGALDPQEAELAIVKPAREKGADYIPEATNEIVEQTRGYPYFLQEWGKHSWDIAKTSPITLEDVKSASIEAIAALDESFFRVRFDRLTPKEKQYLRAMAELGTGPHRSGDIATLLNKPTNSLGPLRASLIIKGMIWSPNHGDTAFTVPLFDEFMKRIMPGADW